MARRGAKGSARSDYGPMPSEARLEAAGSEMKENPPALVTKMRRKFGPEKAETVRRGIMFSKARQSK